MSFFVDRVGSPVPPAQPEKSSKKSGKKRKLDQVSIEDGLPPQQQGEPAPAQQSPAPKKKKQKQVAAADPEEPPARKDGKKKKSRKSKGGDAEDQEPQPKKQDKKKKRKSMIDDSKTVLADLIVEDDPSDEDGDAGAETAHTDASAATEDDADGLDTSAAETSTEPETNASSASAEEGSKVDAEDKRGPPLTKELIGYFMQLDPVIRRGLGLDAGEEAGGDSEDVNVKLLLGNLVREMRGHEFRLSVHRRVGKTLETVLGHCSAKGVRKYLAGLRGLFVQVCLDRNASHAIEAVLRRMPELLRAERFPGLAAAAGSENKQDGSDDEDDDEDDDDDDDEEEEGGTGDQGAELPSLQELLQTMCEELAAGDSSVDENGHPYKYTETQWYWHRVALAKDPQSGCRWLQVLRNPAGGYVLRNLIAVLAGWSSPTAGGQDPDAPAKSSGAAAGRVVPTTTQLELGYALPDYLEPERFGGVLPGILEALLDWCERAGMEGAGCPFVGELCFDQQAGPALQALLLALRDPLEATGATVGPRGQLQSRLDELVLRLLLWTWGAPAEASSEESGKGEEEDEESGEDAEETPKADVDGEAQGVDAWQPGPQSRHHAHELFVHRSGSHLLQRLFQTASLPLVMRIAAEHLPVKLPKADRKLGGRMQLLELVRHPQANFPVQSLFARLARSHARLRERLQAAGADAQDGEAEEEAIRAQMRTVRALVKTWLKPLRHHVLALLTSDGRAGVVWRLVQLLAELARGNPSSAKHLRAVVDRLEADLLAAQAQPEQSEQPEQQPSSVNLVRWLAELGSAGGGASEQAGPAAGTGSLFGSLILQAMLGLEQPDQLPAQLEAGFRSLDGRSWRALCVSRTGSRLVEAFFRSAAVRLQLKKMVAEHLLAEAGSLAATPGGSFAVEACFATGDLGLKGRIVKCLSKVAHKLQAKKSGKMLLKRCSVPLYLRLLNSHGPIAALKKWNEQFGKEQQKKAEWLRELEEEAAADDDDDDEETGDGKDD